MKEFQTAKMDQATKLLTAVLVVLMPLFAVTPFFIRPAQPFAAVALMIILMGAIAISYGFVPKRIALSDSQILVKNLYGAILININDINTVETISKTGFNFRAFGVGGLFGYFGYFNRGEVWYVTNRFKKVKIILKSGKVYMVSPENPSEFAEAVSERRTSAA